MPDTGIGTPAGASMRARTVPTQIWVVAWLVGSCVVWLSNAYLSVETVRWARGFPDTCAGLSAFEQLGTYLEFEDRIVFVAPDNDPESGYSFFCAQYNLAPKIVRLGSRATLEAYATPGTAFLVYFTRDESPEATSKRIEELAANRQSRLEFRRVTERVFLARLVRH
jgi:hypothetical protein